LTHQQSAGGPKLTRGFSYTLLEDTDISKKQTALVN